MFFVCLFVFWGLGGCTRSYRMILKCFLNSCLNFWEAWWFLSFRFFRLLSSSLLSYSQYFGRCVLQPSSGVSCRTREHTHGVMSIGFGSLSFKGTIIWRLLVQSWLLVSNNTGILNTCIRLWLTGSEQATSVD